MSRAFSFTRIEDHEDYTYNWWVNRNMIEPDIHSLAQQWGVWRGGIDYELAFWDRWLSLKGGTHAADYANRTNPTLPVDHFLEFILERLRQNPIRLLDVGAGPLSCLGKVSQHTKLDIVAIDPLADFYEDMLHKSGVVPLVQTQFGLGEDLTLQFNSGEFDVVHCQNALDHSLDPLRVLLQMLHVCRIGGYVMLRHAHNEAQHEQYKGFHKWNLTNEGQAVVIWSPEIKHNLTESFGPFARSEVLLTDGYLINVFEKTADVPKPLFANEALRWSNFQRAVLRTLGSF